MRVRKLLLSPVEWLILRPLRFLNWVFWNPLPKKVEPPDTSMITEKGTYPSLTLALDHTKQAVEHQSSTADALDTKAGFVLASASLLVAVLTVWRPPTGSIPCTWNFCSERLIPHVWIIQSIDNTAWLTLAVSIVVYGLVIYFAGRAYNLRPFDYPPRPAAFVTPYGTQSDGKPLYMLLLTANATEIVVFKDLLEAYAFNARHIEEKVQWLRRALYTFWIEAAVVGMVLIYETTILTHMG